MRTDEERIAAMRARAAEIEREARRRRVKLVQSVAFAASFIGVVIIAVVISGVVPLGPSPEAAPESMHASIFSSGGETGYVVIAIIAFLLGVFVTAFCFRLKKWQDDKDEEAK